MMEILRPTDLPGLIKREGLKGTETLSYSFKSESAQELFRLRLLNSQAHYLIYSAQGMDAKVVIQSGQPHADIDAIADGCGRAVML